MKLKNISIGDFIEAKNKHGGDVGFDVLEIGKSYEVMGFNEGSNLTVVISVPNHKTFCDGFYVCHECFRKPKQNSLIERDTSKELAGSELCKAMLARGDKYVMCRVSDMGDSEVEADIAHAIRGFSQSGFKTKRNTWGYAVPINNQGEPLTASEAGL